MDIERLEQNIRYTFKNKELLKTALTHTSYAHEKKVESNEKLEFLGDSILEFVTSNYLYNNYRKLKEGEMTKVRASVVCESSLYQVALKHNFSDFLCGTSTLFSQFANFLGNNSKTTSCFPCPSRFNSRI